MRIVDHDVNLGSLVRSLIKESGLKQKEVVEKLNENGVEEKYDNFHGKLQRNQVQLGYFLQLLETIGKKMVIVDKNSHISELKG